MAAEHDTTRPRSDSGAVLLRPHHVLCAIGWRGHGYSPAFTQNMNRVVGRLREDPAVKVQFTFAADEICAPCPSRRGAGCVQQDKITALDARHAARLGLSDGMELTWAEAEARAAEVAPEELSALCGGCQWRDLGVCADALAELRAK
ncbi:MAG: DUF1284 domain-containing protein [Paracoccus sp. (in: a-proteobacteria)]|nr:DUF1284 domain-containing protein [Paracoccus sp. (in: a-proteobacteria)]